MVAKRKPSPAVKTLTSNDRAPVKKKAAKKSVAVVSKSAKKPVPAGRLTDKKAPKPSAKESKKLAKEKTKSGVQKSKAGTKKPVPKKTVAAKIPAKPKSAPKKVAIVKAPEKNKPVPKKAAATKSAPKKAVPKKALPKKAAPKILAAKKPAEKVSVQQKITPKAAANKKPVVAKKAVAAKKAATPKPTTKKPSVAKIANPKKVPISSKVKAKPQPAKKNTGNVGSDSAVSFTPYALKRHEEYMNEPQRAHFKSILLNWRNLLMEEVDRTVSHMKDEAANYPDPSDRASQEEEFSLELRTRDRERKLIRKIEKTIDMIDQDDYGYCDTCGVEIGIRRLEARPTANQCIDCKTLDELKERQLHG